jgi:hypothetical protein
VSKAIRLMDGRTVRVNGATAYPNVRVWDEYRETWCSVEEFKLCRPIWATIGDGTRESWERNRYAALTHAQDTIAEEAKRIEKMNETRRATIAAKKEAGEAYVRVESPFDDSGKLVFGRPATPARKGKRGKAVKGEWLEPAA